MRYGPEAGPCGRLEWIVCGRCVQREAEAEAEVGRLEALWAARTCAADDCAVVFTPGASQARFCSDRCRKRTHRRLKARSAA